MDVVEQAAGPVWPALDELVRQAAQGEVMHNDDTGMRILKLAREPAPAGKAERTGVFTTGILSKVAGRCIALYCSGWKHAGENFADVLKHRGSGLAPLIQMCDALSRNAPQLTAGVRVLLAFAWRMAGASLWMWPRTFPSNAAMCWRSSAVFGITTSWRESAG